MNSRVKLALGLAALLSPLASAQPIKGKAGDAAPDASEAKKYDVRVQFDKETAKGEILCKQGKVEGDAVEYEKCAKDKLDRYDEVAVKKGLVESKADYDKLDEKGKTMAKKLAFLDSAKQELEKSIKELGEAKKDDIDYKKLKGALKKVIRELKREAKACKKAKSLVKCPAPAKDDAAGKN